MAIQLQASNKQSINIAPMKHLLVIISINLFLIYQLQSTELNSLTDAEAKEGWKLLFDGKSTDGWIRWGSHKPLDETSKWKVKDGALAITGKGAGDIYTSEAFENYQLEMEWMSKGNSGILFRVDPSHKGAIWNKAPEMQVNRENNPRNLGSTSAGGLYQLYNIQGPEKIVHGDGWNSVSVKLKNDHATFLFNGRKAYEFTFGSDDWKARVAKSKFRKYEGFAGLKKGHIGLQDHGAPVSYRNIRIKVLD